MVNTKVVVAHLIYKFIVDKFFYLMYFRVSNIYFKFTYFDTQFFSEIFK
jgi:hypothetical protein